MEIKCFRCDKPVIANRSTKKFCSADCRTRHYKEGPKAKPNIIEAKAALTDELAEAWRSIQYIDIDSPLGIDWLRRYDALKI